MALPPGFLALAVWFLRGGFSDRVLLIGGVVLMGLGVIAGAAVPDALDAVVILPLAGALLASRCPDRTSIACGRSC